MDVTSKLAPVEFVEKIKVRMQQENIGVSQLARILGVSHPTMIDLVTHGKRPSLDTCLALAKWFRQSEVSILREAGLLPAGPENEVRFEDWKFLLDQMSPEDQEEMRQIAVMKIENRKRSEDSKRAKKLHARGGA